MKRLFLAGALLLATAISAAAQTVPLGPRFVLPYQTVIDPTGIPLAGALLYFYASGTNTPLNSYSDPLLTIPNPNPVQANAAGVFPNIFLSGNYKVILKTSAFQQIWSADPVDQVIGGGSGSVTGPVSSVIGDFAIWANIAGTLLADSPAGNGALSALGTNVGSPGSFIVNGGVLGTPSSGTLTNATGLPLTTGVTGTLVVGHGGTGNTNFLPSLPLLGNGSAAIAQGTVTGTNGSTLFATANGTLTPGQCLIADSNQNVASIGSNVCASGGAVQLSFAQDFLAGASGCDGFTAGSTTSLALVNWCGTAQIVSTGTTLTVSATSYGTLGVGQTISGTGITGNPTVVSGPTTCGPNNCYVLSASQTAGSSEAMTAVLPPTAATLVFVVFDGVTQAYDTFSLSGATVTFDAAIPTNTQVVDVRWYASTTLAGVPSINGLFGVPVQIVGGAGINVTTSSPSITISSNAYIDVSKPPYNARPDNGLIDNSAAVQAAFNAAGDGIGNGVIYLPGTGPGQFIYCAPEGVSFTGSYEALRFGGTAVALDSCPSLFTATISNGSGGAGTQLDITSILYGTPQLQNRVYGSGVTPTVITACPGGVCGAPGLYTVSVSQNISSEQMRIGLDNCLLTMGGVSQQFSHNDTYSGTFAGGGYGGNAGAVCVNGLVNSHMFDSPLISGGVYPLYYVNSSDFWVDAPFVEYGYGQNTSAGGAQVFSSGGGLYLERGKLDQGFPGGIPTNSFGASGWSAWVANTSYSYGNVAQCRNYFIQVVEPLTGSAESGSGSCPTLNNYFVNLPDGSHGLVWQMLGPTQFYCLEPDGSAVDTYLDFGDCSGPYSVGLAITNNASAAAGPQLTHVRSSIFGGNFLASIYAEAGASLTVTDATLSNCLGTACIGFVTGGYGGGTCAAQRAWCGDATITASLIYGSEYGVSNSAGTNNNAFGNTIAGAGTAALNDNAAGQFIWTGNSVGASATWGANALGINIVTGGDYQTITSNNCKGATTGHSGSVGSNGTFANNTGC